MNPFAAHADNMAAYETMVSERVNNKTGGSILYGGKEITAVVSNFVTHQVLKGGGLSPQLVGQAIVQKTNVPPAVKFKTGQIVVAKQVGGSVYECTIESVDDEFTEFRLNLWAKNEKA